MREKLTKVFDEVLEYNQKLIDIVEQTLLYIKERSV